MTQTQRGRLLFMTPLFVISRGASVAGMMSSCSSADIRAAAAQGGFTVQTSMIESPLELLYAWLWNSTYSLSSVGSK